MSNVLNLPSGVCFANGPIVSSCRISTMRMGRRCLLFLAVCVVLAGCAVDPTEQVFTISVLNDTAHSVVISTCNTSCGGGGVVETVTLASNQSTRENQSSEGAPNEYVVSDEMSRARFCFQLVFNTKQPGKVVRLSEVLPQSCE